jgi:hypothetical protein
MAQHRNKRLPLSAPIALGDQTLTEVSVKKPKVKDLKALQDALAGIEDQLEQGILMAAVLTDLPREEMDTDDFTAISEVIAGFFPKGTASATGAPSQPKPPTG